MLFNATQQEELRVAIVDGQKLLDLDIETAGKEQHKSNIYKAVITRIEPSLEACFVNYGEDRHGFLPFKEVVRSLFREGVDVRNASIKDALHEGQEIMVQVEKEERGNKGAALTTFISLAGRYLVLMPNNPRGGGVSRRVEGEERQELRENIEKLDLPKGMSVIARTAGIGRSVEELQWDLNYLLQLWRAIDGASTSSPGAFLIYHESSLVIRAIRDYFQPDIGEILIDTDEIYEQARQFMSHVMPDMVNRVKRYRDDIPLFSRFQIEHQIETAYSRIVPLPSGGSIVIDHTEALVSIDVNSARSTRGGDIETTAFNTNCEAVDEVARQLRLRDLGGLIVIDFIDMEVAKNKREIENRLKEALRNDRARVQMDKISRFGLIELSRQRLRPALSEGSHITCPRCNGTGHIRDVESFALQVLRIIEEESMKESSAAIHIQLPVDVAAFLLNEKRSEIMKIESRHRVIIMVIPNKYLETPRYKLERLKHDDPRLEEHQLSFELAEESTDVDMSFSKTYKEAPKPRQEALVKSISPEMPPPPAPVEVVAPQKQEETKTMSFWDKLMSFFGVTKTEAEVVAPPKPARETRSKRHNDRSRNRNRRRRDRNRDEQVLEKQNDVINIAEETTAVSKQEKTTKEINNERRRNRRSNNAKTEFKEKMANSDVVELLDTNNEIIQQTIETDIVEVEAPIISNVVEENHIEEEPRRRRRRGGRNRNRRDRESIVDSAEIAEIISVEANEIDEMVDGLMTNSQTSTDSNENIQEISKGQVKKLPSENKIEDVAYQAVTTDTESSSIPPLAFYDPNDEAISVSTKETTTKLTNQFELIQEEVVLQSVEGTLSTTPVEEVIELDVSDFVTSPVSDVEEVLSEKVTIVTDTENKPTEESSSKTEKVLEEVVHIETETKVETTQEASTQVESQVKTEKTVSTPTVPVQNLQEMLASAGLVMASTDPEKLRLAQEKAAKELENIPPRPVRRRPAPPVNDEPLIQVTTRKQ